MKISDARSHFNALVNAVYRQERRVLVEKSGIAVAGLVSPADLQRLERMDRERAQRFSVLDDIRAAFRDVPTEELEREAAKAVAEVRAERLSSTPRP
jgi:prevent-host-death family protein